MVDHLGEKVDGDELVYIIANAWKNNGALKSDTVVGKSSSSMKLPGKIDSQVCNFSNTQSEYNPPPVPTPDGYSGGPDEVLSGGSNNKNKNRNRDRPSWDEEEEESDNTMLIIGVTSVVLILFVIIIVIMMKKK